MRIETMTVKLLRSSEHYANDTTELRVSLDDDDDWEAIELELRKRAVAGIEQHWKDRRQAEEDERQRSVQKRRDLRDEYLASLPEGAETVCNDCPANGCYEACEDCPRKSECPW